jgi:hypothetical protein
LLVLSSGLSHRLCKPVHQQAAIGQPGELVVIDEVARPSCLSPQSNQFPRKPYIAPSKHPDVLPRSLRCLSMSRESMLDLRKYRIGLAHANAYVIRRQ